MADDLRRCQPDPIGIRFLHRSEAPRLLLSVLQSKPKLPSECLVGSRGPARVRVDEEPVSGYASSLQRIQAPSPDGDLEDAVRRREIGTGQCYGRRDAWLRGPRLAKYRVRAMWWRLDSAHSCLYSEEDMAFLPCDLYLRFMPSGQRAEKD